MKIKDVSGYAGGYTAPFSDHSEDKVIIT